MGGWMDNINKDNYEMIWIEKGGPLVWRWTSQWLKSSSDIKVDIVSKWWMLLLSDDFKLIFHNILQWKISYKSCITTYNSHNLKY